MSNQFTDEEVAKLKKLAASTRKTHVIQVLDCSGSMITGREITISTYNEQLQTMKAAQERDGGITTVTMVQFSTLANVTYTGKTLDQVSPMTLENYNPDGMTALYDAIGLAIKTAQTFDKSGDTAFLLQILTDGEENMSKNFSSTQLKSMIEELNSTNKWTVTVAGPKGSVNLFAQELSIKTGNVMGFMPEDLNSRMMNKGMMLNATQSYFTARSAGITAVADAYSSIPVPDPTPDPLVATEP